MANYLSGIEFRKKDFNADRIANAIAKQIGCSKQEYIKCTITKEGYEWFGLTKNSNQVQAFVENLLGSIHNVRILVHGTIEDAYISVDWRTISTPRMTLDEGLDCSYTDDYFED